MEGGRRSFAEALHRRYIFSIVIVVIIITESRLVGGSSLDYVPQKVMLENPVA